MWTNNLQVICLVDEKWYSLYFPKIFLIPYIFPKYSLFLIFSSIIPYSLYFFISYIFSTSHHLVHTQLTIYIFHHNSFSCIFLVNLIFDIYYRYKGYSIWNFQFREKKWKYSIPFHTQLWHFYIPIQQIDIFDPPIKFRHFRELHATKWHFLKPQYTFFLVWSPTIQ